MTSLLGIGSQSEDVVGLEEWRWALHLPNLTLTPEKYVGVLGDLVAEGLSLDKILEISGHANCRNALNST